MSEHPDLPQPAPLLIAHARGIDREWHALCWTIDDRMARVAFGKKEGAVAAIRLAWWEEALTADDKNVRGEPTLERWRAAQPGVEDRARVNGVAGAWRMLLDPEPMTEAEWRAFGFGRGALFPLIARGGDMDSLLRAGAIWALWDSARRDPDRQRAEGAFAAAIELLDEAPDRKRVVPRPLMLAFAMALDDVRGGVMPDEQFRPGQYLRLLRRALLG